MFTFIYNEAFFYINKNYNNHESIYYKLKRIEIFKHSINKMVLFSKLLPSVSNACSEAIHPFHVNCKKAAIIAFISALRQSFKIYGFVYLVFKTI